MERKIRIILFEDDPIIRKLFGHYFHSKGYEVIKYQNPTLCPIQHMHDCHCKEQELCADFIITDVDMPYVSGLDFIESQVRKGCKIPNIGIMSGVWTESKMKRAKDLGCTVFEKPINLSVLTEWLNKCVKRLDQSKNLSNWFPPRGKLNFNFCY
jgi:DNA-binding response OmpR family regulator